jgi:hypothetical protein
MSTNFQFENWTELVGYLWKGMGITNFQFENRIELVGYLWEGKGITTQHWLLGTT